MEQTKPKFQQNILSRTAPVLKYFLAYPLSRNKKTPRRFEQGFSCQYSSNSVNKKTAFEAAYRQKRSLLLAPPF